MMKRKTTCLLTAALLFVAGSLFSQNKYAYTVDLTNVKEDRVMVELMTPKVDAASIEFQMPKIVPGTYSISDFGRFVTEFQAMDAAGNALSVDHSDDDPNRWVIRDAKRLAKITYWVDDSWDSKLSNHIFEPGGTNIEAGKNFVINTFGFFGYLEGMKENDFEIVVKKPEGFYGSTALIAEENSATQERFVVQGYNLLADSPMMYCRPDTAVKNVGGATVLVSVFSPNQKTSADAVMQGIAPILEAQRKYLGGKLPVKKYAFIAYLAPLGSGGGGMGALEHSYSSFYFMPEVDDASAGAMMKDVAAHEFFHIVTPLSVHSEEIHYFDFIEPKMSQHLWLYEGVTEYSAGHVQISYDLMGLPEYLNVLQGKIITSKFMIDTVPFTEISAGCLGEYKSQYLNVYQKGALIGMGLDVTLRDLSDGKMGLQDLMRKLEKAYGVKKPFKDDQLFAEITKMTYPEVGTFLNTYVGGPSPLPYKELFDKVGINYETDVDRKILSMGRIKVVPNQETNEVVIEGASRMNSFGKDMGYEAGDVLIELAGMEVNAENFFEVVEQFRAEFEEGDKIKAVVKRPDGKGGFKTKKLKAKAKAVRQRAQVLLTPNPQANERQKMIRAAWLNDL